MSVRSELIVTVCEAIDPDWNKGAAIVERMALDRAERVLDALSAEVLGDFVGWVATSRAYNGSEHKRGQSLYNEGLNEVLPHWALEWAQERLLNESTIGSAE